MPDQSKMSLTNEWSAGNSYTAAADVSFKLQNLGAFPLHYAYRQSGTALPAVAVAEAFRVLPGKVHSFDLVAGETVLFACDGPTGLMTYYAPDGA